MRGGRNLLPALAAALALTVGIPASADVAPTAAKLSPADQDDLARIERYLESIKTMVSRFQQIDQQGNLSSGRIFLARPGRLRVEYDPPARYLLVASGGALVYYDAEVDQLTTLPLSSTPAWFLLRSHISLTEGVTVIGFQHSPGALRVAVKDTEDPSMGSVLLVFEDQPLALRQWTVTDAQGNATQVVLEDPKFGVDIDPNLFALPSARGPARRSN